MSPVDPLAGRAALLNFGAGKLRSKLEFVVPQKKVPKRTGTILIVDDEAGIREFLDIALSRAGHHTTTASSGAHALRLLSGDAVDFDIVLTDLTMPGVDGMELLRQVVSLPSPPLVTMMTAYATADTAIEAMKLGAHDYLIKPFKLDEIGMVVDRALERRALTHENRKLREQLRGVSRLDRMVGRSPGMQKVFGLIQKIAPTRTNILIRGESGTGKELVARALHNLSDRSAGPFIAVNCGAIPETLMESELFGYVRGAFTGATTDKTGVFQAAESGTLFLDEIGELGPTMQVKLLRVLQERSIRRVGSNTEVKVGCRVVAATNRDLEAAIDAGEFRQDLYFRLNVVPIVLPALRHRSEDVPVLLEGFFDRFNKETGSKLSGISPRAREWFLRHDYPGNVRELENLVEGAVALETATELSADHLPTKRSLRVSDPDGFPPDGVDLDREIADLERRLISDALHRASGVRKAAAQLLSISLRSLRYRLEKLGIEVGQNTAHDLPRRGRPGTKN
ncbi:MAG: sigma-54 dependent transcriptional regulator [Nannocystaceae bacterium]